MATATASAQRVLNAQFDVVTGALLQLDGGTLITERDFDEAWRSLQRVKTEFIDTRTIESMSDSLSASAPFTNLDALRAQAEELVATRKDALRRCKLEAETLRQEIGEMSGSVATLFVELQQRRRQLHAALDQIASSAGSENEGLTSEIAVDNCDATTTRLTSKADALAFVSARREAAAASSTHAEQLEGDAARCTEAARAALSDIAELEAQLAGVRAERAVKARAKFTAAQQAMEAATHYDTMTQIVNAATGL